jgi:hypothetical protein
MPPVSPILYKGGGRELWPIASCVDNWIGAACVVVSRQDYQSTCFRLTGRSWHLSRPADPDILLWRAALERIAALRAMMDERATFDSLRTFL